MIASKNFNWIKLVNLINKLGDELFLNIFLSIIFNYFSNLFLYVCNKVHLVGYVGREWVLGLGLGLGGELQDCWLPMAVVETCYVQRYIISVYLFIYIVLLVRG